MSTGALGGLQSALFGDGGAGAAQAAAEEKQRWAKQIAGKNVSDLNNYTMNSLMGFDRDIKNQERNLSRQEQMIAQIDPTILEASQQALKLLRGESASTLGPAQAQRAQQRQKLLNQLREQLGPGAETSTAGIQALTRFDAETNNLLAGQQQSALSNLGNVAGQFNSVRPDMFREIMGLSGLGQGKANTYLNTISGRNNAYSSLLDTAGASYVGDQIRGQNAQAFGNALIEGGITAATGGASRMWKANEGAGYKNSKQTENGTYYY